MPSAACAARSGRRSLVREGSLSLTSSVRRGLAAVGLCDALPRTGPWMLKRKCSLRIGYQKKYWNAFLH